MILKKSRLFSIVVCIITVLSVLSLMIPKGTYAEENDKSLTLVCVSGDTVLVGLEWKIYKVGHRNASGSSFIQTGDFSGIQINLRRMTEDSINKAAQSFQAFAVSMGVEPVQKQKTNERGEVTFTGLDAGLYLISGKLLKTDSHYYVPTTALVEIKESDSDLRYDAYPKFEYQVMNARPVAHIVYKEWSGDDEHLDERPDHVVVDIYRDEEYYESVVLSEENNWSYRWVDADGSSGWIVMERDIPECYEMIIEYDRNYRIENSYTDEPFTTTTKSGATTTSTTTTTVATSISVGQDTSTVVTTTPTTTAPYQNSTVSRTRTTPVTTVTSGTLDDGSFTRTTSTTTNKPHNASTTRTSSGTVTGTTSTTGTLDNGSGTRTTSTSTNQPHNASTTKTSTSVSGGAATTTAVTGSGTTTKVSGGAATTTGVTGSGTTTTKSYGNGSATTTTRNSGSGSGNGSGGGNSGGGKTNYSSSIKLPQTGQLWWPVVPLSIGGVLFVSAGFAIKRKKSDD